MSRVGLFLLVLIGLFALPAAPAFASLPQTSSPVLELVRTIRTTPFVNTTVSMKDGEGSAYVPSDNSLWLAADNGRAVYEVNPITGELKQMIGRTAFEAAPKFGGGSVAGTYRDRDLESMAYDEVNDLLYAFSGKCCTSSVQPTAFRLRRNGSGVFQVESYQPLASGSDFTAAAWNSLDGKLYVGLGSDLRTYKYATNAQGPTFKVPNLKGIRGMSFSSDGADLFVAAKLAKLYRVDWGSKTIVPGWSFDLTPFGILDSRAVELINDQFYVLDGYDFRPSGDPLEYAVFVLDVLETGN